MRVRVNVTGDREVTESLRRLGAAGPVVAKRVLSRVTARIVPMAKALCPVDPDPHDRPGQLRDSIRATRPTLTQRGVVSAGVVAGGTTEVYYAEMQHEDLTLKHTTGQAKFLEIPFLKEAVKVPDELMREIDQEANRAGR
jgi:hypothetical protein